MPTTGMYPRAGSSFRRSHISMPPSSGKLMSRKMTAGSAARAISVPVGPSGAVRTSNPASESTEVKLVAALRERFADELATADGSLLASIASLDLSMGVVEGDRGTLNRSISGMVVPVEIVAIDGLWYIDASSTMAESASQAAALGQSPADLMASLTAFMRELTGRIEAGEFGSLQEVDMAFMQALQTNFGSGG